MASSNKTKEIGTLVVVVLKARNLPDKHTVRKQDPFAAVQLGPHKQQTKIDRRGGQHPIWDEDLHLKVLMEDTKENRTLKISCYAKESKGDDLIGSGEVDITDTLVTGEFDDWVKLEIDGAYRGEVYLEMTFFAAGPPALARRASKLAPSERLWRPPQTPPKTSAHSSPHGSPARNPAELVPPSDAATSRPTHLAPPRSSRSPSPSEPPLPAIPDEAPASLRPAAARPSVGNTANMGVPVKTDPKPIPAALRPGGPTRPPGQQHQHQRLSSIPTSSQMHAAQQVADAESVQHPVHGPQPMPDGYIVPTAQPAYVSPLISEASRPSASPPPQPARTSPRGRYTSLPSTSPIPQQPYVPSWPGNDYPPMSAPSQPVYSAPHPPASPYQPAHPPSSAPSQAGYPPHRNSQTRYSSVAPYPIINPSYDPPPLSSYGTSPPPATAPAMPATSAGSLHLSFPEPSISSAGYPSTYPGLRPNETEEERQKRLSERYGSPMPLPPGFELPKPPAKMPASYTVSKSPSPRASPKKEPPPLSTSPRPMTDNRPAPSRVPESYLEKERAALERRRQEEADAELARRLAAEAEMEESSRPKPPSQEETDEELARRLARELNSDVLENVKRKSKDGGHMPGGC